MRDPWEGGAAFACAETVPEVYDRPAGSAEERLRLDQYPDACRIRI
jgi:hypothetical protein